MKGVGLPTVFPGRGLQRLEQGIEALKILFPERTIVFEPVDGLAERAGIDPPRPALCVAAVGDEAGAFQNLKVFGDRRLADGERLGELRDRRFAGCQTGQDRAPRRIGEGGKRRVELRRFITSQFHN